MFGKTDNNPDSTARQFASGDGFGKADASPNTNTERMDPMYSSSKQGEARCSVIGIDLMIKGDVQSAGNLQVDGTVEGDVKGRHLTVGRDGRIDGSVRAETAHLSGSVSGQVNATFVKLGKSARIVGDITYKTLSIEEGASFEGHCHHIDSKKASGDTDVVVMEPAKRAKATRAKAGNDDQTDGAATPGGNADDKPVSA